MTTHICGAIIAPDGRLVYIATERSEDSAWRFYLGWPSKTEIKDAKARGLRFVQIEVTIPEREPA